LPDRAPDVRPAHVAPDNHASRHVAEAAGFTQADTFTDSDGNEFIRYTRDASGDGAAPFNIADIQ
jgi:hypothetical protein